MEQAEGECVDGEKKLVRSKKKSKKKQKNFRKTLDNGGAGVIVRATVNKNKTP